MSPPLCVASSHRSQRIDGRQQRCDETLATLVAELRKKWMEQVDDLVVQLFEDVQRKVYDTIVDGFVQQDDLEEIARSSTSSPKTLGSKEKLEYECCAIPNMPGETRLASMGEQQHEPRKSSKSFIELPMQRSNAQLGASFGSSCSSDDAPNVKGESEDLNRHVPILQSHSLEDELRGDSAKLVIEDKPARTGSTFEDVEAIKRSGKLLVRDSAHVARPQDDDMNSAEMNKVRRATVLDEMEMGLEPSHHSSRRSSWGKQKTRPLTPRGTGISRPISMDVSRAHISSTSRIPIFYETRFGMCCWNMLNLAILALTIWSDTASMAQTWANEEDGPLGPVWNIVAFVFFATDIIICFNTTFETEAGQIITDRLRIAKRYLKTWFVFDVLVTFPYTLVFKSSSLGRNTRLVRIMRLAKMIRSLKLLKAMRATEGFQDSVDEVAAFSGVDGTDMIRCFRLLSVLCKFWTLIFVQGHFAACFIMASEQGHVKILPDSDRGTPWMHYIAVLRWSMLGCFIGLSDQNSVQLRFSTNPQIVEVFFIILATGNFVTGIALLSNLAGSESMDLEFKLSALQSYLRKQDRVSSFSRKQIVHYHRGVSTHGRSKEIVKLLKAIPSHLKERIAIESYGETVLGIKIFEQGPFFHNGSETFWHAICQALELRFIKKDGFMVIAGDRYEGMFGLFQGDLFAIDPAEPEQAEPCPKFVGMAALFASLSSAAQVAQFTVQAGSNAEVVVLHRKDFDSIITPHTKWSFFVRFVRSKVAHKAISIDDLAIVGLSDGVFDEYSQLSIRSNVRTPDAATASQQLGVCLAYIQSRFLNDLSSEVGIDDFATTNFGDLRPIFWGSPPKGFKGSSEATCPRDGLPGTAIVDVLDDRDHKSATHFVSWCWSYTIESVVLAFTDWARESDVENTTAFLWLCFFCNNQRKLLVDNDVASNLAQTFEAHLQEVGRMIILLDGIENPRYTQRLWCIFEAYTASKHKIKIDMALPPVTRAAVFNKFSDYGGLAYFAHALSNIHAESATATFPEDEENIRHLIVTTTGFGAVNHVVKSALTKWLAKAFQNHLMLKQEAPDTQEGEPKYSQEKKAVDRVGSVSAI